MNRLFKFFTAVFRRSALFLLITSIPVFAALIYVFSAGDNKSISAYIIYFLSAYCLVACIFSAGNMVKLIGKIKQKLTSCRKITIGLRSSGIVYRYLDSKHFRGEAGIYMSLAADTLYTIFRTATGIIYESAWFLSLAAYHAVLGLIRLYLAFSYRKSERIAFDNKNSFRCRCYKKTGILLFALNIPMVGMTLLMIHTDSGFIYPGYIIYLSAMYTFYTAVMAVINIVRYRRLGNPVLSAAKAVNLVSAAMSVLGLQTAMIAVFSEHEEIFRKIMNTATGTGVFIITVSTALFMIVRSAGMLKNERAGNYDEIGK